MDTVINFQPTQKGKYTFNVYTSQDSITIESMIVLVEIKTHKSKFVCACAISRVCEYVIFREDRGGRVDSNSWVC